MPLEKGLLLTFQAYLSLGAGCPQSSSILIVVFDSLVSCSDYIVLLNSRLRYVKLM